MRTLPLAVLVLALAMPSRGRAQPGGSGFTLDEAIAVMRASHPLLVAARADVDAAEGDAIDAALWANPSLDVTYTGSPIHSSYDPAGYTAAGITQFLELADVPGARGRAARTIVDAVRSDYEGAVLALSLAVRAGMLTLVAAQRRLDVRERALAAFVEVGRIVSERVSAGAAPAYDATRMSIVVATARADRADAEADLLRARADFDAVVGPGSEVLVGRASLSLEDEDPLPDVRVLLDRLRDERPDVVAARRRAEAADQQIAVVSRMVFPGIALRLGAAFGQTPGQVDLTIGFTVPIPVVDYGQGSIRASEARARAARAYVDAVVGPASRRLSSLVEEVRTRRAALAAYVASGVMASGTMLAEARAGYEAGRFSVLELADAYTAWRDAQLEAITLASDARLSEVELARTVGGVLRGH